MPKPNYLGTNTNKGLVGMLLLLMAGSILSYVLYGPYYSPDTVNYFDFSQGIFEKCIWVGIYFPAYPFLLHCLTLLPFLSLFQAAHLIILVQYVLGIYFLYQWAKIISTHYWSDRKREAGFLLLLLIIYHSWWSFRIVTWAHADATFYCLLIIWGYLMSQYYLKRSFKDLFIVSLVSGAMIWFKLNALSLVPFYVLLLIADKDRKKWLVPLGFTAASYFGYSYFFQYKLLDITLNGGRGFNFLAMEGVEIMGNNIGAFFKTTLGFFLSDVVAAFVPHVPTIFGGILLLLSLFFLAIWEIKNGLSPASFFLLFGLLYLLSLLTFQQIIGFEQFDYRPLFPYFLACGCYFLISIFRLGKIPSTAVLLIAFLITSHTLAGHLYLWQRQEVNSLFEAERLAESGMMKKVRLLYQEDSTSYSFISNRPELLGLLLDEPFVVHYDPEFNFIHGKRRPVPEPQRQQRKVQILEKVRSGEVILVLFGKDKNGRELSRQHGLKLLEFEEGYVLSGD